MGDPDCPPDRHLFREHCRATPAPMSHLRIAWAFDYGRVQPDSTRPLPGFEDPGDLFPSGSHRVPTPRLLPGGRSPPKGCTYPPHSRLSPPMRRTRPSGSSPRRPTWGFETQRRSRGWARSCCFLALAASTSLLRPVGPRGRSWSLPTAVPPGPDNVSTWSPRHPSPSPRHPWVQSSPLSPQNSHFLPAPPRQGSGRLVSLYGWTVVSPKPLRRRRANTGSCRSSVRGIGHESDGRRKEASSEAAER